MCPATDGQATDKAANEVVGAAKPICGEIYPSHRASKTVDEGAHKLVVESDEVNLPHVHLDNIIPLEG